MRKKQLNTPVSRVVDSIGKGYYQIYNYKKGGLANGRDLGGLKTVDSRIVKHGKFIRSGKLCKLNKREIKSLLDANVKTIIDLRVENEKQSQPDTIIKGIKYISIPILCATTTGITREKSMYRVIKEESGLLKKVYNTADDYFMSLYEFILVLMGIAAGVLYFYSNNEQENTNTINDENANIKDNENTNPKAETSKIEIGKKYECTSSGMVGYIQFTSETDFEMELGAIASENEIKKGTYKIQENIITLNITYDSNYDYMEYTESNEEFEPYTEEIAIIKDDQLAYTNQYDVTFIFVKNDETLEPFNFSDLY